jgi:hypothetical protein
MDPASRIGKRTKLSAAVAMARSDRAALAAPLRALVRPSHAGVTLAKATERIKKLEHLRASPGGLTGTRKHI